MIQSLSSHITKSLGTITKWHVARFIAVIIAIGALAGMIIAFIQYRFSMATLFAILALAEYVHWRYLGKDKIFHASVEKQREAFEKQTSDFRTENINLKNRVDELAELLSQERQNLAQSHAQINKLEELTRNYEEQNATLFTQTCSLYKIRNSLSKKVHKLGQAQNSLRDRCRELISHRRSLRQAIFFLRKESGRFHHSNIQLERITKRLLQAGKNLAQ